MNIFINRVKVTQETEFFGRFNWHKFQPGDVVWLEDWDGPQDAAVFISISPLELHLVEVELSVAETIGNS